MFAIANCLPGPTAALVLLNGVALATRSFVAGLFAQFCFMAPGALVLAFSGSALSSADSTDESMSSFFDKTWVLSVQQVVSLAAISVIAMGAKELFSKLVTTKTTQLVCPFCFEFDCRLYRPIRRVEIFFTLIFCCCRIF